MFGYIVQQQRARIEQRMSERLPVNPQLAQSRAKHGGFTGALNSKPRGFLARLFGA